MLIRYQAIALAVAGLLVFGLSGVVNACICPGMTCDTGATCPNTDCDTYIEVPIIDPTTPASATTLTETLMEHYHNRCNMIPGSSGVCGLDFTQTESLSHTTTGELKTEVGVQCGSDAVGRLGLSQAQAVSDGWQTNGTWSKNEHIDAPWTCAACQRIKHGVTRDYKTGTFAKYGRIHWHCNIFHWLTMSWVNEHGDCYQTNSSHPGAKHPLTTEEYCENVDCP